MVRRKDVKTNMRKIIEVSGLCKSYGDVRAVDGVSFYVEQGALFAFLGPNGAGKTTTIDILCTLLESDGGDVVIDGFHLGADDSKIRSSIGVVFQDSVLDSLLTVKENLMTRGNLYGLSKSELKRAIECASEAAGIGEFIDRPYGKLSGGQRRRADIARALINTPKILFLDEPTTGLDPQTRKNIWDTVRRLQRERDMTVFLTTHYMEEAAGADYVVVIDEGKISAQGTPAELRQGYSSDVMKLTAADSARLSCKLAEMKIEYDVIGDMYVVKLKSTLDSVGILNDLREYITNVEVLNGTMDDAFIGITGKGIRE